MLIFHCSSSITYFSFGLTKCLQVPGAYKISSKMLKPATSEVGYIATKSCITISKRLRHLFHSDVSCVMIKKKMAKKKLEDCKQSFYFLERKHANKMLHVFSPTLKRKFNHYYKSGLYSQVQYAI